MGGRDIEGGKILRVGGEDIEGVGKDIIEGGREDIQDGIIIKLLSQLCVTHLQTDA